MSAEKPDNTPENADERNLEALKPASSAISSTERDVASKSSQARAFPFNIHTKYYK